MNNVVKKFRNIHNAESFLLLFLKIRSKFTYRDKLVLNLIDLTRYSVIFLKIFNTIH